MAKTSGPLMSVEASGSFASTLTFAKNRGVQYCRQLVTPRNPQSTGQQTARSAMGAAGRFNSFIGALSDAQVALNAAAPSNMSGVSYFARKQAQAYAASKAAYENAANATVKGYFDTAATSLGVTAVTIPGSTPVTVPAGLILWNAYSAMHGVDATIAPSAATAASEANITTFVSALTA